MESTCYLQGGKKMKEKTRRREKRKEKKNSCVCNPETRTFALYAFPAFQVLQRIELTYHIGPQSVYVSRALCIIVFWS